MTATMLYKEGDGFTTSYMFGGDMEFDTGVIRNTFDDGRPARTTTLEFPTELFGTTFTDTGSLADEMERRGYVKLVV